jgi:hypothetical protein
MPFARGSTDIGQIHEGVENLDPFYCGLKP